MSASSNNSFCKVKPNADTIDCSSLVDEDRNVCWICLDGDSPTRPLVQPCKCPRFCHARCLARWQLQSAGTRRESQCDFCNGQLPDWRQVLAFNLSNFNAPAIMNVNFEGKTYSFEVKPGTSGYLQFTDAIRQAFQLPADSDLNITFTCDEPCTEAGSLLTLQGPGAYDAAVYCASISAARRQLGQRTRSHTISGLNEIEDPDGSVGVLDSSRQEPQLIRTHHRSRTTIGTGREMQRSPPPPSIYSPEDFLTTTGETRTTTTTTRSRHSRGRSSFFTSPRSARSNTSASSEGLTTTATTRTNDEQGNRRSKRWEKVTKKMRDIYHKFTQK